MVAILRRVNLASVRISSVIWLASSRVGASTRGARALAAFSEEPVKQGEGEGRRLACAGLS